MKQAQNTFRPLNSNELHMLKKFGGIQDGGSLPVGTRIDWDEDLSVSYERIDEFTVCLVCFELGYWTHVWRGVSRRSMYDKPNRLKGEALAFKRAILKSRPVVI